MSLFSNIQPWLSDAVAEVQRIEAKAETELTDAETYIRNNAPILANAVDGFLTTAQTIAGDVNPEAGAAVEGLKNLFDGLIRLVEAGTVPTEGAGIVLPPASVAQTFEGN